MSNSEAENAVALIRRITEGKTLIMVEHDMNIVFDIVHFSVKRAHGQSLMQ